MLDASKIADFESGLARDGFKEVVTRSIDGGFANGDHGHHFTARGLILEGVFTIVFGDLRRNFGPGEIFEVPEDTLHHEEVGVGGVRLIVGRR